ncbi:MFS transporter [Marisediminicola senii]|uniref:MFS transporter n=1 Tax=Marisediminicola senii TaxID=2711233 RepID=UPI001911D771|nr:MFS transporter [Marisediminicola senii]
MSSMFRSLAGYNYRLWAAGAFVSNVGTWMQRTAQDWLVLTELTDNDAFAVGLVMALQFGPLLILLPVTGLVADRFDQRTILMVTQATMGVLGLALGILTVTGVVELWHVYIFAALLGCAAAFDAPARQAFVSELVGGTNLSNAVALNSASFSAARMVGPAVAGMLTAVAGAGAVFLINAATFAAVLIALKMLRVRDLRREPRAARQRGDLAGGFRYIRRRPDIMVVLVMIFLVGTFGLNFGIYIATMARVEFGAGAAEFGVLSSIMAIGSVTGALLSAKRESPRMRFLIASSIIFALGCLLAAVLPSLWMFAAALVLIGVAAQTFMTTANGLVQLSTDAAVRGRVMAIYMAIFMGGTPIGAPVVGWIANEFGPRWSLVAGGAAGLIACAVGIGWLVQHQHLRVGFSGRRLRVIHDGSAEAGPDTVVPDEPNANGAVRGAGVRDNDVDDDDVSNDVSDGLPPRVTSRE